MKLRTERWLRLNIGLLCSGHIVVLADVCQKTVSYFLCLLLSLVRNRFLSQQTHRSLNDLRVFAVFTVVLVSIQLRLVLLLLKCSNVGDAREFSGNPVCVAVLLWLLYHLVQRAVRIVLNLICNMQVFGSDCLTLQL